MEDGSLEFEQKETERTKVTDLFGSGGASSASPASQSSALQASPSTGGRILCFFVTFWCASTAN